MIDRFILKFVKDKEQYKEIDDLYKKRFMDYENLELMIVIISTLGQLLYFTTDCYLEHNFVFDTFILRFSTIIAMVLTLLIIKNPLNYKTKLIFIYAHLHYCTFMIILATSKLHDGFHSQSGLIVMNFFFLAIGLVAPFRVNTVFHCIMLISILVSSSYIQYYQSHLSFITCLCCAIGSTIMTYTIDATYRDSYIKDLKLADLSIRDQLTKAYNRNIINDLINNDGTPKVDKSFVIMCDIDKFKDINDTYGHGNGDVILKSVADTIRDNISEDDLLIRWGGEEFIVYLKHSYYEKVKRIAENIRKSVENSKNGITKVTISLGVSRCETVRTLNESIEVADRALYYSKKHGRNRVTIYTDLNYESSGKHLK